MTHKSKWRNGNSYNNKIKESIRYFVCRIISIYITRDRMSVIWLWLWLCLYFISSLDWIVLCCIFSRHLYLVWLSNMKWWSSLISIANQNRALVAFVCRLNQLNEMKTTSRWTVYVNSHLKCAMWSIQNVYSRSQSHYHQNEYPNHRTQ